MYVYFNSSNNPLTIIGIPHKTAYISITLFELTFKSFFLVLKIVVDYSVIYAVMYPVHTHIYII